MKVKSPHDVHVVLSPKVYEGEERQKDLIEIVIGGWGNSESVIRRGNQGQELGNAQTPNILSNDEFREFWIVTKMVEEDKLEISFGRVGQAIPLMIGVDENPVKFEYLGLGSWANTEAFYKNVRTGKRENWKMTNKLIIKENFSPHRF